MLYVTKLHKKSQIQDILPVINNINRLIKMKRILLITLLSALPIYSASAETTTKQRVVESKKVVKEFMGQLKGELQSSMKAGGPISAISVCKDRAPAIAEELSNKYGWTVGRTSLKLRNPQNAADVWETKVLNNFETRKNAGEKVKPMAHFEEVTENGNASFRFMKAIPMGKPCLVCHGDNISAEVSSKLKEAYPNDKATGFKMGDIRGAFSISQPIK